MAGGWVELSNAVGGRWIFPDFKFFKFIVILLGKKGFLKTSKQSVLRPSHEQLVSASAVNENTKQQEKHSCTLRQARAVPKKYEQGGRSAILAGLNSSSRCGWL